MCVVGAAVAAASLLLAMASSSSAAGKGPLVGEVGRNMIARSNKSALAASLLELQRAGLLNTDEPLTERGIKRQLKECSEYHANVRTPYGPWCRRWRSARQTWNDGSSATLLRFCII